MAIDLDLYDWVFQFLGVTNLSGDPVWDAVTKLLLPMVVLFLFISKVIKSSRFGGTGTELILMFITGFVIIYKGYFAIFADMSIYLLGIIILWHTLSFVFGSMGGKSDKSGSREERGGRLGPEGSGSWLFRKTMETTGASGWNPVAMAKTKDIIRRLDGKWRATEHEASGLRELPPNIIDKREEILKEAIEALEMYHNNDRKEILKNVKNDKFKKALEETFNMS